MPTTLASPMQCVMTVRTLSIDGVQKANSGHPGAPMGLAPVGWQLFSRHLRHSPSSPEWPDRDRFVLSNGHASMLLYSLLHLTGYDVPMEELKRFRQLHSITPGHPERIETPGVEATTGPLGQGMSNAVGLALAEEMLAARYNRPGHELINHRTWFIAGDGCFMEGISHEAASLAGHLKLGKLIGIYDDNQVSLDAMTAKSYNDDVPMRFEAYGWRVLHIEDPNTDLDEIDRVLGEAQESDGRPTLIIAPTHIGYGSPHKQDTPKAHGSPLGDEEVALVKEFYGWPTEPTFLVPPEVEHWKAELIERGHQLEREWNAAHDAYRAAFPEEAEELDRVLAGVLPSRWEDSLPSFSPDDKPEATRAASGTVINAFAPVVPEFVQGAADLSGSTKTTIEDAGDVAPGDFAGRNIYFGVREHAMGAIANGMTAHGGLRVACSTFFQFYDYMKNTVRLAALMKLGTIFVYTHDSIGLGEDGPTHQQVENLAALRAVPGLVSLRPAGASETAAAWKVALERVDGPTALVLSRQGMPDLPGPVGLERGAWVVADGDDAVLIGTGSEVQVALAARELLAGDGINARVVSMPSFELFRAQDQAYRDSVLPPASAHASRSRRHRASAGTSGSATAARSSASTASANRRPLRRCTRTSESRPSGLRTSPAVCRREVATNTAAHRGMSAAATGNESSRSAPPAAIVIFGASGDLTRRKLVPALFSLARQGLLAPDTSIVGVSRSPFSDDEFRERMREGVTDLAKLEVDDSEWAEFAPHLRYMPGSFTEGDTFERLRDLLSDIDRRDCTKGQRLFYLSTAPDLFGPIVEGLGRVGLNVESDDAAEGAFSRVVIEKPFGEDLASARHLNERVSAVFREQQVYRIDHYLGKETVQNLMVLRFGNTIFEPIWNRRYIDHVQITVAEDLGVGTRGGYYEQSGALRDIVQNHVMQLMAIIAMEPPARFDSRDVRDEKVKVLRAIPPFETRHLKHVAVRGQYDAGRAGPEDVPGYRDAEGVDPQSNTETFVALKMEVDNWRWAGTPFYVRTGKRLPARATEITLQFRPAPHLPFAGDAVDVIDPNLLSLRIQPDEGSSLQFIAKAPGPKIELRTVSMDFAYGSSFVRRVPDAYERLLLDCLLGDSTLFTRWDEVERAWEIFDPLLSAWEAQAGPFPNYAAGTWGPIASDELLARDGREWRRF